MNFKRFAKVTLNLNQISSITEVGETQLIITMTNGKEHRIQYSYNQLMSYLQYIK